MFEEISKLHIENVYAIKDKVHAYKCPECGKLHYPAVLRCKQCGCRRYPEDEIEIIWRKKGYKSWVKVPLEGACKLLTHTRLWNLPVGFTQRYLDFGVVEFENGLRALGHLHVEDPKLGMSLTASAKNLREIEGEPFYGLAFERA
jgi:hypothetical protein